MITRTLYITQPCHLKTRENQLVAEYQKFKGQEDLPDKSAAIEDLGFVVLEHQQITMTQILLNKLLENNVAIITCNEKAMPVGMFLNLDGNTLQSERFRAQIDATEPLKKQLWQQTIKCKIQNQAQVLRNFGIENAYLVNQVAKVKSGDTDNAEAKCSLYYWHRIFAPSWEFKRHREGNPPNNLLNYGYAIIRAAVARALVGSGLLPTLGIFHRNKYNAYCLADDIMEPYRPFVDQLVCEILSETSNIDVLNTELKQRLLRILTKDVEIDGQTSPLMVAVQRTAASLAKCYLGEIRKIAYPAL